MDIIIDPHPPIELIDNLWESQPLSSVGMLRLDLLDPEIGGNKMFKLQTNFDHALANGFDQVLSFGGPHSNHLLALALMASRQGIPSLGFVRGEDWELR